MVKHGLEFTSAVSPPSLPADIASAVLGIHGLQPHIRPRLLSNPRPLRPVSGGSEVSYTPSQIAAAYNAKGLSVTGSGQVIALYELAFPQTSDLTQFWAATGSAQTTSNVETVDVAGGPGKLSKPR